MDLHPLADQPGWLLWRDAPENLRVEVGVRLADDGRVEVTELRLQGTPGLSSDQLRSIPLGRIEASVNAPETRLALLAILGPRSAPKLLEFHEVTPRPRPKVSRSGPATSPAVKRKEPVAAGAFHLRPQRERALKIVQSDDRKHPDEFYAQVADVYSWAAGRTRRPAADIAAANDVPVTTAHRWIKECRRRGLLPPGRRGQAG